MSYDSWSGFAKFVFWAPGNMPVEDRHALTNVRSQIVLAVVQLGTNLANIPITRAYSDAYQDDLSTNASSIQTNEDLGYAWSYGGLTGSSLLALPSLALCYTALCDLYKRHVDRLNGVLTDTQQILGTVTQLDLRTQVMRNNINTLVQESNTLVQRSATLVQQSNTLVQQGTTIDAHVGAVETDVANLAQSLPPLIQPVTNSISDLQDSCNDLLGQVGTVSKEITLNGQAIGDLIKLTKKIDETTELLLSSKKETQELREQNQRQTELIGELKQAATIIDQEKNLLKEQLLEGKKNEEELKRQLEEAKKSATQFEQILAKLNELQSKTATQ
jgi:hypothetical protein